MKKILKLSFFLSGACLLSSLICHAADEPAPAAPASETTKTEEKVPPIAVKLALAQNVSGLGRVVAFSITARNTSNEAQEMVFNSGQSFDITATPIKGSEKAKQPVWRWANDNLFTSALRRDTLQPNESRTWTAVWQGEDNLGNPAPRGEYILEAIVTANGGIKAPPLMLNVQPEGIREAPPRLNDLDDGPVAKLETDKTTYKLGESVSLTLTVRNEGHQTISLTFPSGQRYNFVVRPAPKGKFDPKQKPVWQWSAGRAFTLALVMQSFAPGATLTFTDKWDLKDLNGKPLPPGKYAIEGALTANRGIAALPVFIEIHE